MQLFIVSSKTIRLKLLNMSIYEGKNLFNDQRRSNIKIGITIELIVLIEKIARLL